MTFSAEKTEKFIDELVRSTERKRGALYAFEEEQQANRVSDSVTDYLCTKSVVDHMFPHLGAAMHTSLHASMSNKTPREWAMYTKLNIFLLGAVGDLELTRVNAVYDVDSDDSDSDDTCGSLSQLNMSCTTALYELLKTIPVTDKLRSLIDDFAADTEVMINAKKQLQYCLAGTCDSDQLPSFDDEPCGCELLYDAVHKKLLSVRKLLVVELGKQPGFTAELFQRGLGSFVIHSWTPYSEPEFAVMRKPADEAIEKARLAEEDRKQREANEAYLRKKLERELENQKAEKKRIEKRLAELDGKKKKMKFEDSD